MDEKTIADLNAHAVAVAARLGVHAGVTLSAVEKSDVNPGGPRVVLTVYRNPSGPRRRMEFPPNAPDLNARIEKEISALVAQLP
jgi:hypothetical protein